MEVRKLRPCGGVALKSVCAISSLVLIVAACAPGKTEKTQQVGPLSVSVITDPQPLEVGYDGEFTMRVEKGNQSLEDCKITFRQYMPEHEMSSDNTYYDLKSVGGKYRGRGGEFTMGGDWEVEFELACGAEKHTLGFAYHLEWPE